MIEVGIFDLKTHISDIIHKVQLGEDVIVTNRGRKVALITRPEEERSKKQKEFFLRLQSLLTTAPLADDLEELRSMKEEGRK